MNEKERLRRKRIKKEKTSLKKTRTRIKKNKK